MADVDLTIEVVRYAMRGLRIIVLSGLAAIALYKLRRSRAGILILLFCLGSILVLIAGTLVFPVGIFSFEKGGDVHGQLVLASAIVKAALAIVFAVGIAKIPRALQQQ